MCACGQGVNQVFDEIPEPTSTPRGSLSIRPCFREPATPRPLRIAISVLMLRCPLKTKPILEECTPFLIGLVKSHRSRKYKVGSEAVDAGNERKYWAQATFDQSSDSDSGACDNSADISANHVDSPRECVASGDSSEPCFQASNLQHWFKNWQEKRKYKLTASTFSLAIGFWPNRRVQLWMEKIGAREPFSGNMATGWNNIREEQALERYMLITGNGVVFSGLRVYGGNSNPDDEWLAASSDGVVVDSLSMASSQGLLEVKCPFFNGEMKDACPWRRIPRHYIPQAQGLMEIMDKDWMDFYCWTLNGSSLFRVKRDPEYWDMLKIALSDFWWKHVHPARVIYQRDEITNPLEQLSSFVPASRHNLLPQIVIKSKKIVDESPLLVREIHGKIQD